jgi:hypothetical protein
MTCEDNGIVMEVCSAAASGQEAFILITMRDEAGQRVDNTIDLFDSYSINRPFDSSATCERLAYDETTNTALFQIQITQMDGRKITGGKVTFGVGCFLSAKRECDVELRELAVSAEKPALMAHPELRGGAGESEAPVAVLQPNDNAYSPTQGVWITAAGFVDGKLHVQAYYEDILHTDNHGYVYLLDKNGNTVNASAGVSVWDEAHSGSYEEYVFDVGPEALSAYTICGSFTTAGRLTTGNWQVTFPLHIEAS